MKWKLMCLGVLMLVGLACATPDPGYSLFNSALGNFLILGSVIVTLVAAGILIKALTNLEDVNTESFNFGSIIGVVTLVLVFAVGLIMVYYLTGISAL